MNWRLLVSRYSSCGLMSSLPYHHMISTDKNPLSTSTVPGLKTVHKHCPYNRELLAMPTQISIAIYRGNPIDYAMYRHTALHFIFPDGQQSAMHVVGAPGMFDFEEAEGIDPTKITGLVGLVAVSSAPNGIQRSMIRNACLRTPVRNDREHRDWNCQNWVGEALTELVETGCLTEGERSVALDRMMDVCLEATDEDLDCKCSPCASYGNS